MSISASQITDAMRLAMHRKITLSQPNRTNQTEGWISAIRPTKENANQPHPARIPDAKQLEQPPTLAREIQGDPQGAGRPHVCFTLRRVKLLDVDAKYSSIKDLLDALSYAGAIRGDREDQITLEVLQEKVGHYADEATLISVNYDQALQILSEIKPRE